MSVRSVSGQRTDRPLGTHPPSFSPWELNRCVPRCHFDHQLGSVGVSHPKRTAVRATTKVGEPRLVHCQLVEAFEIAFMGFLTYGTHTSLRIRSRQTTSAAGQVVGS